MVKRFMSKRSMIYMDKPRLQQVISNLVQNAIKYSYQGTIEVEARCFSEDPRKKGSGFSEDTFGKGPGNKVFEIRVRDQGLGM